MDFFLEGLGSRGCSRDSDFGSRISDSRDSGTRIAGLLEELGFRISDLRLEGLGNSDRGAARGTRGLGTLKGLGSRISDLGFRISDSRTSGTRIAGLLEGLGSRISGSRTSDTQKAPRKCGAFDKLRLR